MKVAIIMGSDSDWLVLKPAVDVLKQFGVGCEVVVASAHRTPDKVRNYVLAAPEKEIGVFISAAGMAAHLGGVIASYTTLPVIGVPINSSPLNGVDALLSTVQMPPGIPVATVGVNAAKNAALFAVQILAVADEELQKKLKDYRTNLAAEVDKKAANVANLMAAANVAEEVQEKVVNVASEVTGKVANVASEVTEKVKALF